MEFLIVLAIAVAAIWFFFFRNKEENSVTEAAPYKVEAPEKTETVVHHVAGIAVTDTVPAAPAVEAAPVAESKPKKKTAAKKPAAPRKKKAV